MSRGVPFKINNAHTDADQAFVKVLQTNEQQQKNHQIPEQCEKSAHIAHITQTRQSYSIQAAQKHMTYVLHSEW